MIGSLSLVAKNCSVASGHLVSCRAGAFLFRRPIAIGKDRASRTDLMSELRLRRCNGVARSKMRGRQNGFGNLPESATELDISQGIDIVKIYDI
jgi:hypothetical protein